VRDYFFSSLFFDLSLSSLPLTAAAVLPSFEEASSSGESFSDRLGGGLGFGERGGGSEEENEKGREVADGRWDGMECERMGGRWEAREARYARRRRKGPMKGMQKREGIGGRGVGC
jgi:hypothetical protein